MRSEEDDVACRRKQGIDLVSGVKELYALSSQDLGKLIREAENSMIQWTSSNGPLVEINVVFLAKYLALHLISKFESSRRDEEAFRYLLGGLRLAHALCDLAPRYPKIEQILVDDVRVLEQMLDLIFYVITVLAGFKEKIHVSTPSNLALLHSALLASSLYLLTTCISSQWNDIALVLLAHNKVDVFMSVAFSAIHVDIQFLQEKLSVQLPLGLTEVNRLCLHCEASLQFLQSLCQQKPFRERLVKNKDLCEEGGILLLVQDIMKLPFCEDPYLMAVVSRMKSKVLSILLQLCEVESVSFLDLAASTTQGLELAKSTMFEVLELLKIMFRGDLKGLTACSKNYPRGLLQLNAMRLTEILSDDSNFRSYVTLNFTQVLTMVFSQPHGEFLSSWCSSELQPSEEDVTLDYDSLTAAGWVLGVVPLSSVLDSTFNACRVPRTSYAHQRTSLLVKVVANLTCFVPDLCKEEKGLFLNKFMWCVQNELAKLPDGPAERTAAVIRNLRSLLVHAESLIPGFLNEDDVQLLRLFIRQLEPLVSQELSILRAKEVHNNNKKPSPDGSGNSAAGGPPPSGNGEGQSDRRPAAAAGDEARPAKAVAVQGGEPNRADSSTSRLKNPADSTKSGENAAAGGAAPEEDPARRVQSEEKQQLKKRKRNIMNDTQIAAIEAALRDEPDMQRKAASIEYWAEKISLHGSEITSSQLKNWLNNRKAKLARAAAKDVRAPSGGDDGLTDKQGGSGTDPVSDSPESPVDEFFDPPKESGVGESSRRLVPVLEPGQYVVLTDPRGEEIGKGCIHLASGSWFDRRLDESGLCVVDVTYLKVDKWSNLPYPCDATGATFGNAEQILGRKRVLWDYNNVHPVQPPPPPPPPPPAAAR